MSSRFPRKFLRAVVPFLVLFSVAAGPLSASATAGTVERSIAASEAVLSNDDADAWLEEVLPAGLEREEIAGASVAIVHNGEVVASRGFGFADTGRTSGEAVAATDATLFRVGSISKLMTANAVMTLVERGLLDLDAPVSTYLDFDLNPQFEEPVTLRHLLTHTAGFEDRISGVVMVGGESAPPLRDVALQTPAQIFAPGTTPAYSNYGNSLAGYVVERVSGTPFEDFMHSAVLEPAGMVTASGGQPLPASLAPLLSRGYTTSSSPEVPFEIVGPAPAGSVSASANDMAAFMLSQLIDGSSTVSPVVSPASLVEMQRPALTSDQLGNLANGPQMTLGYFEGSRNGRRTVGHGGDLHAFHAQLELYPESGTGIYVAMNSIGAQPDSTVRLREEIMQAFADRYLPVEGTTAEAERLETSAEHAEAAAGTYWSTRRVESSFLKLYFALSPVAVAATDDGNLTIADPALGSVEPVEFQEVEPWVWQEIDGERRVAMAFDGTQIKLIGSIPAMTLQPMPGLLQALPAVLLTSGIALLGALMTWAAAGISRIRQRKPVTRTTRWLLRANQACAVSLVAALGVWVMVGFAFLNGASAPVWQVRLAQVLLVLGAAGIVPAFLTLAQSIRVKMGIPRVMCAALSVVGYLGVLTVALVGGLLSAQAMS